MAELSHGSAPAFVDVSAAPARSGIAGGRELGPSGDIPAVEPLGSGGDWPYTKRIMPWLLAGFLVMIWFVPLDSIIVPISLPVDSSLDRFVFAGIVLVWLIVALGAGQLGPRMVRNPVNVAVLVFVILAALSVITNIDDLARLDELNLTIRKLLQLVGYGVLFLVVVTTIRRTEVAPFLTLILVLATVTALGVIIEYRTGTNFFYDWSRDLIPGVSVAQQPIDDTYARPAISGPTRHGLAITAMFAMAAPIALARLLHTTESKSRLFYAVALGLTLAGGIATLRKTGAVAPAAALVVVAFYRPGDVKRLVPLGVVMVLAIQLLAPSALGSTFKQLKGGAGGSTTGARTADYVATEPDVLSHPLVGRGYGSYDPRHHLLGTDPERHRIIDNQYLLILIETGILGILAYVGIVAAAVFPLHRLARGSDPARAGPAMGMIGSVIGYAVANALFDTLAFPHVPYLFFFMIGLAMAYACADRHTEQPETHPGRRAEAAHA